MLLFLICIFYIKQPELCYSQDNPKNNLSNKNVTLIQMKY